MGKKRGTSQRTDGEKTPYFVHAPRRPELLLWAFLWTADSGEHFGFTWNVDKIRVISTYFLLSTNKRVKFTCHMNEISGISIYILWKVHLFLPMKQISLDYPSPTSFNVNLNCPEPDQYSMSAFSNPVCLNSNNPIIQLNMWDPLSDSVTWYDLPDSRLLEITKITPRDPVWPRILDVK